MTDDGNSGTALGGEGRSAQPDRPSATRRSVLALAGAGASALAGCPTLPGLGGGEGAVTLDGAALSAAVSEPVPAVSDPLPVDVTDAHLEASRSRAESALDSVPLPLSADELPNGVMRERLGQFAADAREELSRAGEATAVRERLDALRGARGNARRVAAAWAYTEGELTPADVRERAGAVTADAREFRDGWRYVGREPVRALLVHGAVEAWIESARGHPPPSDRWPGQVNAVTVGEAAGEVERGRAYLADVRHVGAQFRDSLADPASVRSTITAARRTLTDAVASRRRDLPGRDVEKVNDLVDADVAGTPAGAALEDLHRSLPDPGDLEPSGDPATDVLRRFRDLATVGAFASLRDRIEGGERFTVESVDDVRALRSATGAAVESALADSADRRLARAALADYDEWVEYVDRDLGRYGETVEVDHLERELGTYVEMAAIARAVPDACSETLAALDAA